jgi:hypothetical protein
MQDEFKNIKIDNSSFERVEEFKYSGKPLTNQNFIQVKIKIRLKSGNACYNAVENLLSSSLLPQNLKIKISSSSSSSFGTTTLCGFSPSQPSLSNFFCL